MAEDVLVGNVDAVGEDMVNDEPQFKVSEKDSEKVSKPKASSTKGAVVLLGAVGLAVAVMFFLDDILALGSKQPNVKNPDSIATLEPVTGETAAGDYVDDYEIQSLPTALIIDEVPVVEPVYKPAAGTTLGGVQNTTTVVGSEQGENGQGINLVLANRLKELSSAVEALSGHVGDLNGQLLAVKNELGQQNLKVQRTLDSVVATLEVARAGDNNRDSLISKVLNDVRGFQKDIGDQRQRFSFKILHDEFYGGKERLIGYEESSPQTILKVYVGADVGLWRFVGISNGEALFRHVDGKEHRERLK